VRPLAVISFLTWSLFSQGQLLVPVAQLDTSDIRIGEQATLTLSIHYDVNSEQSNIDFPEIFETLAEHVEVVSVGEVEAMLQTPDVDPHLFVKKQHIVITSWDSGLWAIPPFVFHINDKPVETEAFLLRVEGVYADTSGAYRGITDLERLPFSLSHWLKEHWKWLAGGVGILAVLYLLFILLKRIPKKKEHVTPQVELPLHVRMLERLEQIEQQQLWQAGKTKLFYSEVTEVMRAYVEERYTVPALERTTHELRRELNLTTMPKQYRELLLSNLEHADMVKFAKFKPIAAENELLLANAFRLIKETTYVQTPDQHV